MTAGALGRRASNNVGDTRGKPPGMAAAADIARGRRYYELRTRDRRSSWGRDDPHGHAYLDHLPGGEIQAKSTRQTPWEN